MSATEPRSGAADGDRGAVVVPYENGPLLIRGDFVLRTPAGEVIDPGRATVALRRCGRSMIGDVRRR